MNLKTIQTRLETSSRDEIAQILDSKAKEKGEKGTTDYIGRAFDNIESAKYRIKKAIAELTEIKKSLESQEEIIKAGVADWLISNGVQKISGDIISSISVYKKAESVYLIIDDEEACINDGYFTMSVDKTSVKTALVSGIKVNGARIETTHNEPSVKVNRKRSKTDDTLSDFAEAS